MVTNDCITIEPSGSSSQSCRDQRAAFITNNNGARIEIAVDITEQLRAIKLTNILRHRQ